MPYFWGILALFILWGFYRICTGDSNPLHLAVGQDDRASASKFQFFLWTVVVVFSYVVLYSAKASHGDWGVFDNVPPNLLILMGVSTGSMVLSKGIMSIKTTQGSAQISKPEEENKVAATPAVAPAPAAENKKKYFGTFKFKYLVFDDDGYPALNQMQMIAWTFISIVIYLVLVVRQTSFSNGVYVLPNVDESLLVLMGISQGAYLGKKLVTTSTPILKNFENGDTCNAGDTVKLNGDNMGSDQGGGQIVFTAGDRNFYPSIKDWKDKQIELVVPQLTGGLYNVTMVTQGKQTNSLTLKIN
jgi:hypothetical protein